MVRRLDWKSIWLMFTIKSRLNEQKVEEDSP